MTANDLYQDAVDDMAARKEHWGVSRYLVTGGELICSVKRVAGRSIVAKHFRTTWGLISAGERYAKSISRATAVKMLAEG
jgi:hypothetical protein